MYVRNFGTDDALASPFGRDKARPRLRARAAARYYLALHPKGIVAKILTYPVSLVFLSVFDGLPYSLSILCSEQDFASIFW